MLKENLELTPSEVQPSFIILCLRQEGDSKEVENAADRLLDKQWIANEKKKREERDTPMS